MNENKEISKKIYKKTKPESVLEIELIQTLESMGYSYNKNIENEKDLKRNLRKRIEELNGIKFEDHEFERIYKNLTRVNKSEAFDILREKHFFSKENDNGFYYRLIDFDKIENNKFEVINQLKMRGTYRNRYDVTLLVNGFPLVHIELKKSGVNLEEAFLQIERYKKHSFNELFNYTQIFVISNEDITKYYSNSPGEASYKFTFFWTGEKNNKYFNLFDFTKAFLEKNHLIDMIENYMINNKTDKNIMILRPYQYYACTKIVDKVLSTPYSDISQDKKEHNAYIWHSTGSGKTLTSFKVSQILSNHKKISKVIFLVDRKDLDIQTTEEFNKLQKGSVDNTDSTKVLMEQLQDSSNNLILTTIQKMNNAVKNYGSKLKHLEKERIVFVIDECHRSQFGDMHKIIRKFFQKAQFIGFTGTPIFKENALDEVYITSNIFGECIHHYMIKDAISDQNVLPFYIEHLKTFDKKDDIEDVKVSKINTEEIFKADERIEEIVRYIIEHHKGKTADRKYNAIFATDSVESAIKYSKAFREISKECDEKDRLKIATIYSYEDNVKFKNTHPREELDGFIGDYNKMFDTNFSTETMDAYRNHLSKSVKNVDIDILIVVDMFLTGFDAKNLRVLYLDKNLKYHGLLQAFSRTNRILDNGKATGIIVSFRDIREDMNKALALFNDSDSLDGILIKDLDEYIKEFKEYFIKLQEVCPKPNGESFENLRSEDDKKEFVLNFRELLRLRKFMEVFVDFDFNEEDLGLTESDFSKYQSFYLSLYNQAQDSSTAVSILNDIDFYTDIIQSDLVDYDYIFEILDGKESKEDKRRRVINILNETTDENLRYKKDLIIDFINSQNFIETDSAAQSFNEYMKDKKEKEFKEYSEKSKLTIEQLKYEFKSMETSYENKWNVSDKFSTIREYLKDNNERAGIIDTRKAVESTHRFLTLMYKKYEEH